MKLSSTIVFFLTSVALLISVGLLSLYSVTSAKIADQKKPRIETNIVEAIPGNQATSQIATSMATNVNSIETQINARKLVGTRDMYKQAQFVLVGIIICALVMCFFDYRQLNKKWVVFSLFVICAILLTYVYFCKPINGAHRWISLPGVSFQPSELAKFSIIVYLAWFGSRYPSVMGRFWRGIVLPMIPVGVLIALIFFERDAGSTAFLFALCCAMLLVMGVKWQYLILPAFSSAVVFCTWLCLDPIRSARILSWQDLEATKQNVGSQQVESLFAFFRGGISGKGLGHSYMKMGRLKEDQTDFIFPIIGEEMGLIATLGIVFLYGVLVYMGTRIALHARDRFGKYLAIGLTWMIGLQAIINMGVVTGLLPNKGMPLPFISKGGSNVVILLFCMGIIVSIALRGVWSKQDEVMGEENGLGADNVFCRGEKVDNKGRLESE